LTLIQVMINFKHVTKLKLLQLSMKLMKWWQILKNKSYLISSLNHH